MTTFDIGAQNAASIQNIGGDAVICGGVHASASFDQRELRAVIGRAREQAAELELPAEMHSQLDRALVCAEAEAVRRHPDEGRLVGLIGSAGRILEEAGVVATDGTALIETLRRAAELLGPIGYAALALL
jgi:hypothetical protein